MQAPTLNIFAFGMLTVLLLPIQASESGRLGASKYCR